MLTHTPFPVRADYPIISLQQELEAMRPLGEEVSCDQLGQGTGIHKSERKRVENQNFSVPALRQQYPAGTRELAKMSGYVRI